MSERSLELSGKAAEYAHLVCQVHNAAYPEMGNIPIQTVYEWLCGAWLAGYHHEELERQRKARLVDRGLPT